MTQETNQEAKKRCIDKMGEPLGTQYAALWQEVVRLHMYWAEYVELFGTKPTRIDLLNRAARSFFRMLQDELWESRLLHIARITDPPTSVGEKTNLTLRNLPNLIDDKKLKAQVDGLIKVLLEKTKFARDWRNRVLAHLDLDLALDQPAKPLLNGSRLEVNDALKAIADVMNIVAAHYLDEGETAFHLFDQTGGADALLYVLDNGLEADAARTERLKTGKSIEGDFDAKDL
jgi:hypothetical protein